MSYIENANIHITCSRPLLSTEKCHAEIEKEANSQRRCVPDAKTRYTHDEHVWENAPPRNAINVYTYCYGMWFTVLLSTSR